MPPTIHERPPVAIAVQEACSTPTRTHLRAERHETVIGGPTARTGVTVAGD